MIPIIYEFAADIIFSDHPGNKFTVYLGFFFVIKGKANSESIPQLNSMAGKNKKTESG